MEDSDSKTVRRRSRPAVIPAVVAIITARAGSKGLPSKNTVMLAGIPLVQHTIAQAIASGVFSEIIVSTDCPKVRAIAERFLVSVHQRPAHLATDEARSEDVVADVLMNCAGAPTFVLLQPTSPLRTARHITDALDLYSEEDVASVVSVCEVVHHPYKALLVRDGQIVPAFSPEALSCPRQALPQCVRQNGAIYVCDTESFLRERRFILEPSRPYLMTVDDSIDIDTTADVVAAERCLARRAVNDAETIQPADWRES